MKKQRFAFLMFVFLFNFSQGQKEHLFVGNSLIKYKHNHTLEILNEFLVENDSINFSDFTFNGSRLFLLLRYVSYGNSGYLTSDIRKSDLNGVLQSKQYACVILQQDSEFDKPILPLFKDSVNSSLFSKCYEEFDSLVKEAGAKAILLENYISFIKLKKKGSFKNKSDSMYKATQENIEKLKLIDSSLQVIPSGYLVKEFIKKYPKARTKLLFSMHPHKNIQYLLACILYAELTKKSPSNLAYNYKIKPSFAREIRGFVWDNYSSLSTSPTQEKPS